MDIDVEWIDAGREPQVSAGSGPPGPDDPRSIELPCKQPGPPTLPADGMAAAPALTLTSELQATAGMPAEMHQLIRKLRIAENDISACSGYLLPDKTVHRCHLSELLERGGGKDLLDIGNRRVADDYIEPSRVSTVFLGLDHGFHGKPLWFETMVFGGPHADYMRRYETYADALAGHAETVKMVREADDPEAP